MGFIEIVEEQETFEHAVGDSTLILRRFDSEVYRDIERRHTRRHKNLRQGGWIEEQDTYAINADLLDYMVVDWRDVRSPSTKEDVPCTRENKLKLPNSVKIEILEACDADFITSPEPDKGQKKRSPQRVCSLGLGQARDRLQEMRGPVRRVRQGAAL